MHGRACLFQFVAWNFQFRLLEAVGGQDRDFLSRNLHNSLLNRDFLLNGQTRPMFLL
jgi:hypothetical protein